MKYDKTTLAGVAVCIAALLLWNPMMRKLGWVPQPSAAPPSETQTGERPPAVPDTELTQGGPAAEAPETVKTNDVPEEPRVPVASEKSTVTEDTETETVTSDRPVVSTPPPTRARPGELGGAFPEPQTTIPISASGEITAFVDPNGGGIAEVRLHNYVLDDRKTEVSLGRPDYPLCAVVPGSLDWTFGPAKIVEQSSDWLSVQREVLDQQLVLIEEWRVLADNPYQLQYRVRIRNSGAAPRTIDGLAITCGAVPPTFSDTLVSQRGPGSGSGVDIFTGTQRRPKTYAAKDIKKQKDDKVSELAETPLAWLALHSKYFLFYVGAGEEKLAGCALGLIETDAEDSETPPLYRGTVFLPSRQIAAGEESEWTLSCYAGPKEFKRLHEIGNGLDGILQMDMFLFWHPAWMGAISRTILKSLIRLNKAFDHRWGYGFAIVIVTLVVKLVFWPLTHRSTVSMRKMQKLQPRIQEIRDRYKDNPQKLQRKTMELYREEKVSPLGGCLPMFLQIPVFFALFNTFRSAIELRHASFLWVADLALPDTIAAPYGFPIRPLAICMGGSMLAQQKMMPTSGDPAQARMMTFMTVGFMFIFYKMPAGLTLYWTVNQILTILQNLVTRRMEGAESAGDS